MGFLYQKVELHFYSSQRSSWWLPLKWSWALPRLNFQIFVLLLNLHPSQTCVIGRPCLLPWSKLCRKQNHRGPLQGGCARDNTPIESSQIVVWGKEVNCPWVNNLPSEVSKFLGSFNNSVIHTFIRKAFQSLLLLPTQPSLTWSFLKIVGPFPSRFLLRFVLEISPSHAHFTKLKKN